MHYRLMVLLDARSFRVTVNANWFYYKAEPGIPFYLYNSVGENELVESVTVNGCTCNLIVESWIESITCL